VRSRCNVKICIVQKYHTACRYFVAEGVACGHSVHWAAADGHSGGDDVLHGLPQIAEASSREVVPLIPFYSSHRDDFIRR